MFKDGLQHYKMLTNFFFFFFALGRHKKEIPKVFVVCYAFGYPCVKVE